MKESKRRSWLLVPPSADAVAEALVFCPDVLVVDTVELVSPDLRVRALKDLPGVIERAASGDAEVFLQVDAKHLPDGLEAGMFGCARGIVLSRLETPEQVRQADALLAEVEARQGVPEGSLHLVASLDTSVGNHRAMELLQASPRMWGATLGRADLTMDLRPGPDGEFHLMPYLTQRLIIVAGAAGVTPLGAWWRPPSRGMMASPMDTYEATVRGKALGFLGAFCVSEEQVEPVHRGFDGANWSPSA